MVHSLRNSPTLAALVALALPATALPATARAAPSNLVVATLSTADDQVPSVELRFDTVLLGSPDGQAALQHSIRHAARLVCNAYYGFGEAPSSCREEVVADANAQLDQMTASSNGRLYASAR